MSKANVDFRIVKKIYGEPHPDNITIRDNFTGNWFTLEFQVEQYDTVEERSFWQTIPIVDISET